MDKEHEEHAVFIREFEERWGALVGRLDVKQEILGDLRMRMINDVRFFYDAFLLLRGEGVGEAPSMGLIQEWKAFQKEFKDEEEALMDQVQRLADSWNAFFKRWRPSPEQMKGNFLAKGLLEESLDEGETFMEYPGKVLLKHMVFPIGADVWLRGTGEEGIFEASTLGWRLRRFRFAGEDRAWSFSGRTIDFLKDGSGVRLHLEQPLEPPGPPGDASIVS